MTPTQEDHEAAARIENSERRWKMLGGHPLYCDCSLCTAVRVEIAAALSEAVRVAVEKERADAALFVQRLPWVDELGKPSSSPPSCDTIIEALKARARSDAQATPAPEPPDFAAAERCICGHAFMYHTESPTRGCIVSAKHCPQFQPAYIRGTPPETGEK